MIPCISRAFDLKGKGTRTSEVKVYLSLKDESSQDKLKEFQSA